MITKKFNKQYLQDTVGSEYVVSDVITGKTRWSLEHEMIFIDEDGLFWKINYSCAISELQEEAPFEYSKEEIDCTQVKEEMQYCKVWVEA